MGTNAKLSWSPAGPDAVMLYLPLPTQPAYPALLHQLAHALCAQFPTIYDTVPAYRSLLLRYSSDVDGEALAVAGTKWLQHHSANTRGGREVVIPVCYQGDDFAPDLPRLCARTALTPEAVIALHSSRVYDVYCIGFLPGFAFLGYVDDALASARHAAPKHVCAGSVGIAGRQTGCYPLDSPGGWQIIGRTPMPLYAPQRGIYSRITPGDRVRFHPIGREAFASWEER